MSACTMSISIPHTHLDNLSASTRAVPSVQLLISRIMPTFQ